MAKQSAVVTQDPNKEKEVPRPVLAQAIVKISEAFVALRKSGLNERAIITLVADASGVGRPNIRAVLNSLVNLKKDFTEN